MHKRPLIIAHRGSMFRAPENTLSAFRLAIAEGADGIELDLRTSRDGELIILHDATLDRTTNGRGLARIRTLRELKELTISGGQKIPLLQEVFQTLPSPILMNIEVKDYDLFGRIIRKTLAVIYEHRAEDRVVISSFSPIPLYQCRKEDSRIPTALIHFQNYPRKFQSDLGRMMVRPKIAIFEHPKITQKRVRELKNAGFRVWCGTTDREEDMRRVIRRGVEAVITGDPALLKRIVDEET